MPYSSPPEYLFPSAQQTPSFSYHSPLFTLRCFRSPPRRSPDLVPRPTSLKRESSVGPPPFLEHTTRADSLQPFIESEEDLASQRASLSRKHKPYTLELTLLVGKKKVHKSAVVRERCKRRFREAVRLVVCRGASGIKGEEVVLQTGARDGPRKWLVPGTSNLKRADAAL